MASNQEIAQLVLQVDASTAVAQRNIQQLAAAVKGSANDMNGSLATVETAHARLSQAFNNSRIAQTELTAAVTRSVDAYGAGAPPLRILMTEMGRLSEAAMFLGGGAGNGVLGAVTRFLGGPWGVALLVAGSVIAKLVSSHHDASDAVADLVDKMRKQAAQAVAEEQANRIWANSLDGVADAQRRLREEIEKGIQTEHTKDLQDVANAQAGLAKQQAALPGAQQAYAALGGDAALARLESEVARGAPGVGGLASNTNLLQDISTLKAARNQVLLLQAQIAASGETVRAAETKLGAYMGSLADDLGALTKDQINQNREAIEQFVSDSRETNTAAKQAIADNSQAIMTALADYEKAASKAAEAGGATADSAVKRTNSNFGALTKQLLAGKEAPAAFAAALIKMAVGLNAVAAAAENAKKGTGDFGKQVDFSGAEAIAAAAGLTVTSGYRSEAKQAELYRTVRTAANPVARPGTSAHEGVNGKWALDIAFAPGLTAENLKKIYGDQGVSLTAVYKESGHYHIEGRRPGAGGGADSEAAAARAQQKQLTDDDAFAKESEQFNAQILAAKKQLVGGYDTQALLAAAAVDAEKAKQLDSIQQQLDEHKITEAQAEKLRAEADDLATAKKAVIAHQAYVDGLNAAAERQQLIAGFREQDLQFADQMATTQKQHRQLQLDLLDIVSQQKVAELERLKKIVESNADFATSVDLQNQAANLQAQIDRAPIDTAQQAALIREGTMNPLEAWANAVPKDADHIIESLQSIEARGLDSLASAISGVVTGTESMKKAFAGLAQSVIGDIVEMTIKMLIFKALTAAFGNVFGGSGADLSGLAGTFSGFGTGNVSFTPAISGARASGGPVSPGAVYLVGENGPELFSPSSAGVILPNRPRIEMGSGGRSQPAQVRIEVAGSDYFDVRVVQVSGAVVDLKKPGIVNEAQRAAVKTLTRRPIGN